MTLAANVQAFIRDNPRSSGVDVRRAFPSVAQNTIHQTLTRLVNRGLIRRVADGVYEAVDPVSPKEFIVLQQLQRLMTEITIVEVKLDRATGAEKLGIARRAREDAQKVLDGIEHAENWYLKHVHIPKPKAIEALATLLKERAAALVETASEALAEVAPAQEKMPRGKPRKHTKEDAG